MTQKCWICEKNDADSGEHIILKSVLDKIMGKPKANESRFISFVGGKRNIPVKSFKNMRFKFKKSICKHCNNTLTQPYDDAFRFFIRRLFGSKRLIILRNRLSLPRTHDDHWHNLALYFIKIFGCLLVEYKAEIRESDFQLMRNSLLYGKVLTNNVYFCAHRDLRKLSAKQSKTVAQFPAFGKDFVAWTIDLDWISIIISCPIAPPIKYGNNWQVSNTFSPLRLGKLR